MASKKPTPDIFDQWASAAPAAGVDTGAVAGEREDATATTATAATPTATPVELRRAVQELLKNGVLEHSAKPQMFSQIANDTARVNAQLEPLDLEVRVDDVRGLAFVAVAPSYLPESGDEAGASICPHCCRSRADSPALRRQTIARSHLPLPLPESEPPPSHLPAMLHLQYCAPSVA